VVEEQDIPLLGSTGLVGEGAKVAAQPLSQRFG
jgi:hypothetical protein